MIAGPIRFAVRNPVISLALFAAALALGYRAWTGKTVDAIPDISENQVVVVAEWPGRSPQDVEDQVTYPLSTALAGVRGVREVRSLSGFGFSQVYVIFQEELRLFQKGAVDDFYQSRTRVLEKLPSLAAELPEGVVPELGPDATALGQVFWYTVDGPLDLASLRSLQDYVVRFELQAVPGVAEVASAGGMVRQYQVDVDPDKLRYYGASILDVVRAIRRANLDVGAKTLEHAGSETLLRGLGFIRRLQDVEELPVGFMTRGGFVPAAGGMAAGMPPDGSAGMPDGGLAATPGTSEPLPHRPLLVRDLARVELGPEFRRGALADGAGERVGGVVVMRFGENPRDVIAGVREAVLRLNDPASGLLPEGVRVSPFYDRTQLIEETTRTLESALAQELLITLVVVLLFLLHLRSSLIVAVSLPLAVLLAFVLMEGMGVDSNIMSLTGIAIAIGTMVDMGVVMTENVYRRLEEDGGRRPVAAVVEEAAVEVGPALLTAVATTILSFVPIFFLTDVEGKLFRPLAWTKTFALAAAAVTGVLLVPVLCRLFLLGPRDRRAETGTGGGSGRGARRARLALHALAAVAVGALAARFGPGALRPELRFALGAAAAVLVVWKASSERLLPTARNPVSRAIEGAYEPTLRWILAHKAAFLVFPGLIVLAGILVAAGGRALTAPLRALFGDGVGQLRPVAFLERSFPGLGQEFMPPLDEGSLLYMPSLLPQASLSQALEVMRRQNERFESVPEVARVVGKLGRAESALDPAPVGMIETVLALHPRSTWRPGLKRSDLEAELLALAHTPGLLEGAGAWLQPIETRVIMLNSGLRAPLAVKLIGSVRGSDGRTLEAGPAVAELERVAAAIREEIAAVPGVAGPNVENLGGKPYLEFQVDRERAGHEGVTVDDVNEALRVAVGGAVAGRSLEGRERYGIRVAYPRELRDGREVLDRVLVRASGGRDLPLAQLAEARTVLGPAAIKTEDGRVRLHVTFAARGRAEGSVMEDVLARIADWRAEHLARGEPDPVPAGVAVEAAGRYESQERARRRFAVLIPICLAVILFLLYLQFRSLATCLNVFAGVPVCVAGGLVLLGLFPGIRDAMVAAGLWDSVGEGPIHVTVAVVVGFIALVGIATDDGVVMATFLEQSFTERRVAGIADIREAVVQAGLRRIRPCLMTTATTVLALYPILASAGRGSDVAQPMALPAVGGMLAGLVSLFLVPCVYAGVKEWKWKLGLSDRHFARTEP